MTKSLTLALGGLLLLSLGVFSVFQVKKLKTTKTHLSQQIENIQKLEETLASEEEEKGFLTELNYELQEENQMLRDSIDRLHRVIRSLRIKVKKQDGNIMALQQKLDQLENNYANLKQEIAVLSRREIVETEKIQNLETQKAAIKKEMVSYETQKQEIVAAKTITENEIEDKENSEERFRRIVDVVNNTRIRFQSIYIQKDANGKPISRLISNGKNWKYTGIEFFMEHDELKQIIDQKFIVKIVNLDSQQTLALIESNPAFPTSKGANEGVSFYFDGNLVEVTHFNNQPKKGANYEVQIFHQSDDGEEYLLLDGVKQFVKDGSVIGF